MSNTKKNAARQLEQALNAVKTAVANLHIKLAATTDPEEQTAIRAEISKISASIGLSYTGPMEPEQAAEAATGAQAILNDTDSTAAEAASSVIFQAVPGLSDKMVADTQAAINEAAAAIQVDNVVLGDAIVEETVTTTPSYWARFKGFVSRNKYYLLGGLAAGLAIGFGGRYAYARYGAGVSPEPVASALFHKSAEAGAEVSVGFFGSILQFLGKAWATVSTKAGEFFTWAGGLFNKTVDVVTEAAAPAADAPAAAV